MELGDYFRIFARRWRLIVALTVLGVVVAIVITALTPKRYAAQAKLFVGTNGGSAQSAYAASQYAQQRMSSYAQLGDSQRVLSPVISSLGLHESVQALSQDVVLLNPSGTVTLDVTVTRAARAQAIDIAQAVAQQLGTVIEKLEGGSPSGAQAPVDVTVTQSAVSPGGPVAPRPALNLILGLLSGFVLGAVLAIVRDQLDRTVRAVGDAEAVTGLPVLGAVPYSRKLRRRGVKAADDQIVDACRELRANLSIATDGFPRTLTVLSPAHGDGRSSVAALLATVLARGGVRTCLVEADFRRPAIATLLGVRSFPGLADVLDGSATLDEALTTYDAVDGNHAEVLTAGGIGKTDVTALLETANFDEVLSRLGERFDIVIVDVPPVLTFADGLLVARRTQATLVVARPGTTNRDALRAVVPALAGSRSRLAGVALNATRSRAARAGAGMTMLSASAAAAQDADARWYARSTDAPGFLPPDGPELLGEPPERAAAAAYRRGVRARRRVPDPDAPVRTDDIDDIDDMDETVPADEQDEAEAVGTAEIVDHAANGTGAHRTFDLRSANRSRNAEDSSVDPAQAG